MDYALTTSNLSRRFADVEAVKQINLAVPLGSFYGFLGPNGAGKSTTIQCLTGLLKPTSGEINILGLNPVSDRIAVQKTIGVVPEDLALFDRLTAEETLGFVGRVHGLSPSELVKRRTELLERMQLHMTGGSIVADFSHGMKKKLALAASLIHAPKLLFLDEPFEGVDAVASRDLRLLLQKFVAGGGTVFVTSHILEIVERLCDHIAIIRQGELVVQGSMESLKTNGTLEERFLEIVGAEQLQESAGFEWLA